jgi:hypothetical protein
MMTPLLTAILLAQQPTVPLETMNVTVKEVISSTTFTVNEGFTVRINCIKPNNKSRMELTSLQNLLMPGDPVMLEYNTAAIVSHVYAPLFDSNNVITSYVNIGLAQIKEGHAVWDYSMCGDDYLNLE